MTPLAGDTVIDCKVALLTANWVEPLSMGPPGLANLAVILATPWATPVATPVLVGPLLMVAAEVLSELQPTTLVIFCALPSLNAPVAVNLAIKPGAIKLLTGDTEID